MSDGRPPRGHGFTLLELAIVLVIVGLVVGGVVIGQDMVRATALQSTVAQIARFNSAALTFKAKYNGLPGDLSIGEAGSFGLSFFVAPEAGEPGGQNGDGRIEGQLGSGSVNGRTASGETLLFWRHLSEAGYVGGQLGNGWDMSSLFTDSPAATMLPASTLSPSSYFAVYHDTRHYLELNGISYVRSDGWYLMDNGPQLSCAHAHALDSKLDDGLAYTGVVVATQSALGGLLNIIALDTDCVDPVGDGRYQILHATGTCGLRIQATF